MTTTTKWTMEEFKLVCELHYQRKWSEIIRVGRNEDGYYPRWANILYQMGEMFGLEAVLSEMNEPAAAYRAAKTYGNPMTHEEFIKRGRHLLATYNPAAKRSLEVVDALFVCNLAALERESGMTQRRLIDIRTGRYKISNDEFERLSEALASSRNIKLYRPVYLLEKPPEEIQRVAKKRDVEMRRHIVPKRPRPDSPDRYYLNKNARTIRTAQFLRLADLAEIMGIGEGQYSHLEFARYKLHISQIRQIAEILSVEPEQIYDNHQSKKPFSLPIDFHQLHDRKRLVELIAHIFNYLEITKSQAVKTKLMHRNLWGEIFTKYQITPFMLSKIAKYLGYKPHIIVRAVIRGGIDLSAEVA